MVLEAVQVGHGVLAAALQVALQVAGLAGRGLGVGPGVVRAEHDWAAADWKPAMHRRAALRRQGLAVARRLPTQELSRSA